MKLIVGLGNPGDRYEHSRHNVGFWVADELAKKWHVRFRRRRDLEGWVGQGLFSEVSFLIVKPLTYMNQSGRAVFKFLESFKLSLKETLVILDDIFLRLGALRLRLKGRSGGHKGLESILDTCETTEIPRLRLGVGLPQGGTDWVGHVLNPFTRDELEVVREMVQVAVEVVSTFVVHGAGGAQKWLSDFQSKARKGESAKGERF